MLNKQHLLLRPNWLWFTREEFFRRSSNFYFSHENSRQINFPKERMVRGKTPSQICPDRVGQNILRFRLKTDLFPFSLFSCEIWNINILSKLKIWIKLKASTRVDIFLLSDKTLNCWSIYPRIFYIKERTEEFWSNSNNDSRWLLMHSHNSLDRVLTVLVRLFIRGFV